MAREMLKLRKGDSAIMIKSDGSIEMAGVNDKELVDDEGRMSPVILFAAAWARKDQQVMNTLIQNFKQSVREGFFGKEAQDDFKAMEVAEAKEKMKEDRGEMSAQEAMQSAPMSASESVKILNEKGIDNTASTEEINKAIGEATKKKAESRLTPDGKGVIETVVGPDGKTYEVTMTKEEKAKKDREEARLEHIVKQGQDPRVKRQQDALKAGATKMTTKKYDKHLEKDLPVEQTMAYQKASPSEQAEMKKKEKEKNQTVGNATIEEK